MKNPLKQVDFKSFNDLLLHLNPNIQAFSACDANGNVFWINEQSYKNAIEEVTSEIHENKSDCENIVDNYYFRSSDSGESLHHKVLFDLADRPCGGLTIVVKDDREKNNEKQVFIHLILLIFIYENFKVAL